MPPIPLPMVQVGQVSGSGAKAVRGISGARRSSDAPSRVDEGSDGERADSAAARDATDSKSETGSSVAPSQRWGCWLPFLCPFMKTSLLELYSYVCVVLVASQHTLTVQLWLQYAALLLQLQET